VSLLPELHLPPNALSAVPPALRDSGPLDLLVRDVRIVAAAIFTDAGDGARVVGAMLGYANQLRSLSQPQPRHPAWTHVALIVQLLACSGAGIARGAARGALARLDAFLLENADLLDLS
jgi:hypothetical protein